MLTKRELLEYAVDRSSSQFKAPFNQIVNEHRVYTYEDTSIIAANSDTPYSGGFLDLRAEPIVVSVPHADLKRYYVVQLTDWPKETPPSILPPGEGTWQPPGVARAS